MGTQPTINSAAEANNLANLFLALSQAVDDLRLSGTLQNPTPEQLQRLKDLSLQLGSIANGFIAQAIGATLQTIQADLANIKNVTADAKTQLGHLNNVSKAISIATAALGLGTAIVTGNPAGIIGAAQTLTTALTA